MLGCFRNRHGRQPFAPEPLAAVASRRPCANAGVEEEEGEPAEEGDVAVSKLPSSKRPRANTDEEAVFVRPTRSAEKLEAEIAASVRPRLEQEAESSLRETLTALRLADAGGQDKRQAARQRCEELSRLAEDGLHTEKSFADGGPTRIPSSSATLSTPPSSVLTTGPHDLSTEDEEDGCNDQPSRAAAGGEEELRLSDSLGLAEVQSQAESFLRSIGLRPQDAGARNKTRWRHRVLWNQCFYLSLARAYLGHAARPRRVRLMALCFRRAIEAVVLERHPAWAEDLAKSSEGTGRAMVFADFLPVAMRTEAGERNLLATLAVCILDSVNGHVEVFIGPDYGGLQEEADKQRNLVLLWYKPWHYQCLVQDDELGSKVEMSYEGFKALLTEHGVVYIETRE